MPNSSLFPEPPTPIAPDAERPEPLLWIRRLAVLEQLAPDAKTIREMTFRQGLNIIRTAERPLNETRPVGHSVGKTQLLRLIRYCLGEHAFATRVIRQRIAERLPEAYVLAEFQLAGEAWVVARPIGTDSGGWTARSDDFAAVLPGADDRQRHKAFADAVESALCSELQHAIMPISRRAPRWLDLLGWLARDQECRFARHNEWREPDAESGTPRLAREDAGLLIRAVMDLLSRREQELRSHHAELHSQMTSLENHHRKQQAALEREQQELRRLLEISDDIPDGPMLAKNAAQCARGKQESLQRLYDEQADSTAVDVAEGAYRDAADAVATTSGEIRVLEGVKSTQQTNLAQLRSAATDDHYSGFVPPKPWCRFYNDKEQAVAEGCPGKEEQRLPGAPDPYRDLRISEVEQHIDRLEEEIESKSIALAQQTEARKIAEQELKQKRDSQERRKRPLWERVGHYQSLAERAERYQQSWESWGKLETAQQSKQREIDDSLAQQQGVRARQNRKLATLSGYFDSTLKALLGEQAGGEIEITAQGVFPRPTSSTAASGAALSTSTVLAFDMACLIASICGVGHHPRLLLHDSPREADMEAAVYHRLLHFAAELDRRFGECEPSFQYIVTTTTPPPAELAEAPCTRLVLDARDEAGLLLGMRY